MTLGWKYKKSEFVEISQFPCMYMVVLREKELGMKKSTDWIVI